MKRHIVTKYKSKQIKCFDVGQPREVRVMSVLDAFVRKTLVDRRKLTYQEHISMHYLSKNSFSVKSFRGNPGFVTNIALLESGNEIINEHYIELQVRGSERVRGVTGALILACIFAARIISFETYINRFEGLGTRI